MLHTGTSLTLYKSHAKQRRQACTSGKKSLKRDLSLSTQSTNHDAIACLQYQWQQPAEKGFCVVSHVIFEEQDLRAAEEEARRHHQSETCQGLGTLGQSCYISLSRKLQDLRHALDEACLQDIHVPAGQQNPTVSATGECRA